MFELDNLKISQNKKKLKNHSSQSFHPIFKMLASKYSENHDLKVEQIKMANK